MSRQAPIIKNSVRIGTSLVLILGGWALFTMFEWDVTFAGMESLDKSSTVSS